MFRFHPQHPYTHQFCYVAQCFLISFNNPSLLKFECSALCGAANSSRVDIAGVRAAQLVSRFVFVYSYMKRVYSLLYFYLHLAFPLHSSSLARRHVASRASLSVFLLFSSVSVSLLLCIHSVIQTRLEGNERERA